MKKLIITLTFTFALISLNAQNSFSERFLEANTLIEEKQHNVALPLWLKLLTEQPDNNNVNYKTGLCYLKSANEKGKSLSYLEKAAQNTTKNYDPFSGSEKKAPFESYFYLAEAYQLNYQIDLAKINYIKFKDNVSKKHYLFNEVDNRLNQCENAKQAIAKPVNIKINNMGEIINSPFADYSPVLSIDESSIYFTSRRIRNDSSNYYTKDILDGQHYEDILVSHNYDGQWTKPELINISTEDHEAVVNISADGQTLFIYKDGGANGDIYTSQLEEEDLWSEPVKLGSDINKDSRETHAHTSPDGNLLYFVSDRKGGLGGLDIYVCKKLPNGQWAKAQNVGETINTKYDEDGIFIHPDGKTMYFSSKGHSSIGGFDIFSSTMDDEGNWTTPINIGYPVNSTDNDIFFVTSADGKRGYYSSYYKDGFGEKDIYQISLDDASAKPLTLLTGYMKMKDGQPLPDDAVILVSNNESNERTKEYTPRRRDGKFSIILNPGNDYHIVYSATPYKQEEDLYIPPVSAYQEINRGIDLEDVLFGAEPIDGSEMVNSGRSRLDQLNATLSQLDQDNTQDDQWKNTNRAELDKLKASLAGLDRISDGDWNEGHNDQLDDIKVRIDKLKASYIGLDNIYSDDFNKNSISSYQEFFNYNSKDINTGNQKYIGMIDKAIEQSKSTGKIKISLESSASYVPTKTYKTNTQLAFKRANDAKAKVIASLVAKGVNKDNIVILNINSKVRGPKYKGDFTNKSVYEKFQYVTIRVH